MRNGVLDLWLSELQTLRSVVLLVRPRDALSQHSEGGGGGGWRVQPEEVHTGFRNLVFTLILHAAVRPPDNVLAT